VFRGHLREKDNKEVIKNNKKLRNIKIAKSV
jgi:hypothetical protein